MTTLAYDVPPEVKYVSRDAHSFRDPIPGTEIVAHLAPPNCRVVDGAFVDVGAAFVDVGAPFVAEPVVGDGPGGAVVVTPLAECLDDPQAATGTAAAKTVPTADVTRANMACSLLSGFHYQITEPVQVGVVVPAGCGHFWGRRGQIW